MEKMMDTCCLLSLACLSRYCVLTLPGRLVPLTLTLSFPGDGKGSSQIGTKELPKTVY